MFGNDNLKRIEKLEDNYLEIYTTNLKLKTQVDYLLNTVIALLQKHLDKKCNKCGK